MSQAKIVALKRGQVACCAAMWAQPVLYFALYRSGFLQSQLLTLPLALGTIWALVQLSFRLAVMERRATQASLNLEAEAAVEEGAPFFLYLRPFRFEHELNVRDDAERPSWRICGYRGVRVPADEYVRSATKGIAPTMAIGRDVSHLGATQYRTSNAEWFEVFARLAEQAVGIFVVPATTRGSQRELDWIRQNGLDKTLFLMPAAPAVTKDKRYWDEWYEFVKHYVRQPILHYRGGELALRAGGVFLFYGTPDERSLAVSRRWEFSFHGLRDASLHVISTDR